MLSKRLANVRFTFKNSVINQYKKLYFQNQKSYVIPTYYTSIKLSRQIKS